MGKQALELENPEEDPRDVVFQTKPLCRLSDSSIAFISRHQIQVPPPRNTPYPEASLLGCCRSLITVVS